ncbi:Putative glycosyltransferase [Ignavibacterium album JCM 16511]|uniref:Putative glycosyltransferase n=1 Tax=Ignavibacterium album (strain DSM 19864 / JCM 16511 / NBRC 101810 / Mat9-16) TaxID=945713 RepID=I0AHJ6_IGNAJ|nr:glycosyltransferase family 2 protein [Ignavibacterium album]AFH48453.1 Putative glycosyltransferase [Ignavibacterium album JCM 16511]
MIENQLKQIKPILSIIIINYNLEEEIDNCLDSLLKTLDKIEELSHSFEIIIVDNNSPNKNLFLLEEKYKSEKIHFFYSEKNLGFGKGCNLGASKAKGEFLLFLNPDTIVEEDIFTNILDLFNSEKKIGIIGPKQQTRKPCFDFSAGYYPNVFFELFNLFGLGVFFEGFLVNLLTKLSSKEYLNVHWILGAAIFIRKELFDLVDGFDKDYFMFFEEVDLCRRVYKRGYRIVYFHKLKIHHIGSVSGKRNYFLYTVRTYASKYLFLTKHYKFPNKQLMTTLLRFQLISQIIIWSLLSPLSFDKSKQKIKSFLYLISHQLKNEIDIN